MSPSESASPSSSTPGIVSRPHQKHIFSNFTKQIQRGVPRFSSAIVAVVAVFMFLRAVSSRFRHLSNWLNNLDRNILQISDTSLAWSVALFFLAGGLAYRKRIAWLILTIGVGLEFLDNIALYDSVRLKSSNRDINKLYLFLFNHLYTHSPRLILLNILILSIILLILLISSRQFYTHVRRGNLPAALTILIIGLTILTICGMILLHHRYTHYSFEHKFIDILLYITGLQDIGNSAPSTSYTYHVIKSIGVAVSGLYCVVFLVLMRSQRSINAMTAADEIVVRRLNDIFGYQDSLAYYATRRDKAIVWAPNARAAITYRVELGVCVAGADPIGEENSWPYAIAEWLRLCRNYGWIPAVEGASRLGAQYYADEAGLKLWELGDEAIIYCNEFSLSGAENKSLRQSVNRARRNGISVRIRRQHELTKQERNSIDKDIDRWRVGADERGFSMALGRFGDPADTSVIIVEAIDSAGKRVGVLTFVPWGENAASLDIMRRSRQSPNGTIELMVTELVTHGSKYNITKISLNFAMLRRIFTEGSDIAAGPIIKIFHKILVFFSRFWQLESLYKSSSKYNPQWFPRYVCYPSTLSMPKVGFAIAIAEGFVARPKFLRRAFPHKYNKHTGLYPTVPAAALEENYLTGPEFEKTHLNNVKYSEQVGVRLAKTQKLYELGIDPYPVANPPSHTAADAEHAPLGTPVSVAGRILAIRSFGGVLFAEVSDWSGKIQVLFDGKERAASLKNVVDLGDIIRAEGTMGLSRTGRISLLVDQWEILAKCLHPLPDKRKGLADPEAKVRLRYVDLAISPLARQLVQIRTTVIKSLRSSLDEENFLEVETPILQNIHGGANATPFKTRIQAYNLDLYLRIAPELYLKKLLVGGVNRVYELGRQFRNEGADATHNPEFTSLEAYAMHGDYFTMRDLTQKMIKNAARAVHGREVLYIKSATGAQVELDISGTWPMISLLEAVTHATGHALEPDTPTETYLELCRKHGIETFPHWSAGEMLVELFEALVEKKTSSPVFYCDFPEETAPLTRKHRSLKGFTEKWDLIIGGMEVATAYSELTDPIDQRNRLTEQSLRAASGNPEAMEIDESFLHALELGMPPSGGLGLGVDRLIMLITGKNIRETLLFPLTKTS